MRVCGIWPSTRRAPRARKAPTKRERLRRTRGAALFAFFVLAACTAAPPPEPEKSSRERRVTRAYVPELEAELDVLPTVFLFRNHQGCLDDVKIRPGDEVLDIGTGTGLLGLLAARQGAKKVVATDINPLACRNARRNAKALDFETRFEVRRVSPKQPDAYSVVGEDERFDVIVSNPPFKDDRPTTLSQRATRDYKFEFLRSILEGADAHLNDGGRILLFQGFADGFRRTAELVRENGFDARIICPDPLGIDLDRFPENRLFIVLYEITRKP